MLKESTMGLIAASVTLFVRLLTLKEGVLSLFAPSMTLFDPKLTLRESTLGLFAARMTFNLEIAVEQEERRNGGIQTTKLQCVMGSLGFCSGSLKR